MKQKMTYHPWGVSLQVVLDEAKYNSAADAGKPAVFEDYVRVDIAELIRLATLPFAGRPMGRSDCALLDLRLQAALGSARMVSGGVKCHPAIPGGHYADFFVEAPAQVIEWLKADWC